MEMTFGREVGHPSRMIDLSLRHRSFRSLHQRVSSNFSPAFSHSLALTASIKSSKPFPSKASRPAKRTSDIKDLGPAFFHRKHLSQNIEKRCLQIYTKLQSLLRPDLHRLYIGVSNTGGFVSSEPNRKSTFCRVLDVTEYSHDGAALLIQWLHTAGSSVKGSPGIKCQQRTNLHCVQAVIAVVHLQNITAMELVTKTPV